MFRKPLLALALLALGGSAQANTFTFVTSPGATEASGLPVDAKAVFTTSADTLTIDLTNLLVNPKSVAQNISDIFFNVGGLTTGSVTSGAGTSRTVASDGSYTDAGTIDPGWQLTNSSGLFHLSDLPNGTLVPAATIIGSPDASNVYSNANNSITGGTHSPFLAGTVHWVLNIAGVTADSTVTDVVASFGTDAGNNVPLPEPAFYQMSALMVLGGMGFLRLRKARKNA